MVNWRPLFFVVIFTLFIPACTQSRNSETVGAQPAELPTETMNTVPTVVSDASATPGSYASNDINIISEEPPDTCPVTKPPDSPFLPPQPYPASPPGTDIWYGTEALWTAIPQYGVWNALPHNSEGYTQKVFWWSKGYSVTREPEPQLTVTGKRLDAQATPLNVSKATNVFAADIQSAMLVGVGFPTLGCWEITGRYGKAELSFVVWVAP